jgi:hypothetical protein
MESENETKSRLKKLPACATEYIKQVIKKMRYRRKVRQDVQVELAAHFEDELKDCKTDEKSEQKAKQLITEFGDVKLLAVLLRRAKKRCRTPWRKTLVRSFQVLGIIILYFIICFIPLLIGSPTISVNYVDWLNELVQGGRDEADNARPYYEKAVKLYVEMPQWLIKSRAKWPTDFNDVQLSSILTWLEANQGAFKALREGSQRPGYWSKYQGNETETELSKTPMATALMTSGLVGDATEILTGYKRLARALRWQIQYEADNGDIETALSNSVALTKFSGHLQGHGLLIEQLVGIAIEGLARSVTFTLLDRVEVPADVLKNTQKELNKQFGRQGPVFSLEAEKAFWYDHIQRTFTDDGQGGGRPLKEALPIVVGDWKDALLGLTTFSYPGRQEMVEKIEQFYNQTDVLLKQTSADAGSEDRAKQLDEIAEHNPMLRVLASAYGRISNIVWRMKTGRQALLTVLAVKRYEKEKGRHPTSLDELVAADYLKILPIDSYSDKPLVYKKTDDNFILYSFGPNFTDDGGEPGKDSDGRVRKWMKNGDTFFWPLPEPQTNQ